MDTRTRIIVAAELAAEGLSICAIARQLDRHRETIGLWLKAIRIEGLSAFLERHHYTSPASRLESDAAALSAELL